MRVLNVLVFSTLLVSPYPASAQVKPASKWSLDERISIRLDPTHIRKRVANQRREMMIAQASPADSATGFVIDGSATPELFMPWELMDSFLSGLGHDEELSPQVKDQYTTTVSRLGWDEDAFWQAVTECRRDYVRTKVQLLSLLEASSVLTVKGRRDRDAQIGNLNRRLCQARSDALAAVRRHFSFDDFLYAAVAPSLRMSSSNPTDGPTLLWIEGGCR